MPPFRLANRAVEGITMPNAQEEPVSLHISQRKSGDVTIIDLHGRATIGRGNDTLVAELRQTLEAGARKLLVNLANTSQVDSSGISTIVRAFVTLQRKGGSLKLLNPNGRVREVLEVTRLLNAIPTFEDEAKALASFK